MAFADLTGHGRVKEILRADIEGGRASGTYLFLGPAGVGKLAMAMEFARAFLCRRFAGDACGSCASCLKFDKGSHPDFLGLKPEGTVIRIEALRDLTRQLQYRPFEGGRRAAIIEDADRMKPEAANAMLKTLEEPPADTVVILVSSHGDALLDTIRSRCRKIPFGALTREEVRHLLVHAHGRPPEEADLLSRLSEGSLRTALDTDLEAYVTDREVLSGLLAAGSEEGILRAGLAIAESMRRAAPERLLSFLATFSVLVRDLALCMSPADPGLRVNVDYLPWLEKTSRLWSPEACQVLMAEIHGARKDALQFANKPLLLFGLAHRAAQLFAGR